MEFGGRHRETQHGGGFGGGSSSSAPSNDGGVAVTLLGIDRDLSKFKESVESVGTQLDTHENRAELKRLRSVIKSKVSSTKTELKEEKKAQAHNPQGKILVDRQTTQLESQLNRFQKLLEMEKTAVKESPHARSSSGGTENGSGSRDDMVSPAQSQAMSQMQRMGGMAEREEEADELRQLETDILDLRDIHQDMAQLVGEQGTEVDAIEKNVSQAQVRTEAGTKQTTIAVELKKKGLRLKLIIGAIVIAAIVAVIVVLAILLGIFVPRATNS